MKVPKKVVLLVTVLFLTIGGAAEAKKPKPSPPPKVLTLMFLHSAPAIDFAGPGGATRLAVLETNFLRTVLATSGIDTAKYRVARVYSGPLPPVNFHIPGAGEDCNMAALTLRAVLTPAVQAVMKSAAGAVVAISWECNDIFGTSGVALVKPTSTAQYARNGLIGVFGLRMSYEYDPVSRDLARINGHLANSYGHELGHGFGAGHPRAQQRVSNELGSGMAGGEFASYANGLYRVQGNGKPPLTDQMGTGNAEVQPFYANNLLAKQGMGSPTEDVVRAILKNWDAMAALPETRKKWLYGKSLIGDELEQLIQLDHGSLDFERIPVERFPLY